MSTATDRAEALAHKRERFVTLFEEHWKFPGRGDDNESAAWWQLIDDIPLDAIPRLVARVEAEYDRVTPPRRGRFRAQWRRLRPAQTVKDKPPSADCGLCENSGHMWATGIHVKDSANSQERYEFSCNPADGPLYYVTAVCFCEYGSAYLATACDMAIRQALFNWRQNVLAPTAAGGDVKCHGTPEKWYASEMVRRSWQRYMQPPETDNADAPSHDSASNATKARCDPTHSPPIESEHAATGATSRHVYGDDVDVIVDASQSVAESIQNRPKPSEFEPQITPQSDDVSVADGVPF